MTQRSYYVYIITNKGNAVFYIGVTNDIVRRMYEHKHGQIAGFSKRYQLTKLVHLEETSDIEEALKREKQLKNWHREWKVNLIRQSNPDFNDLSAE